MDTLILLLIKAFLDNEGAKFYLEDFIGFSRTLMKSHVIKNWRK